MLHHGNRPKNSNNKHVFHNAVNRDTLQSAPVERRLLSSDLDRPSEFDKLYPQTQECSVTLNSSPISSSPSGGSNAQEHCSTPATSYRSAYEQSPCPSPEGAALESSHAADCDLPRPAVLEPAAAAAASAFTACRASGDEESPPADFLHFRDDFPAPDFLHFRDDFPAADFPHIRDDFPAADFPHIRDNFPAAFPRSGWHGRSPSLEDAVNALFDRPAAPARPEPPGPSGPEPGPAADPFRSEW